jgi:hypothetical protein
VEKEALVELQYPRTQALRISREREAWEYRVIYPPPEYMPGWGLRMRYIFRLSLADQFISSSQRRSRQRIRFLLSL